MKLKDIRETYYSYTAKASDISRQISFAGIAIIWIFKTDVNDKIALPDELICAAILLLISLSLDLFQYIYASAAWGIFHRVNEMRNGVDYEDEIVAPSSINWPTIVFFWGKLISLIFGYYALIHYGLTSVSPPS